MLRRDFNLAALSAFAIAGSNAAFAQEEAAEIIIPEMFIGAEDAPVTFIEYSSFTCSHCASFHKNVFPQLKTNFIDTGKVRFINREVYANRFDLWAAMIARCGDGSRYFGILDLIFEKQAEWTDGTTNAEIAQNLYKIGRIAGFQNEEMETCLQNNDIAKAMVERYQETAGADDVSSTPTIFINGDRYGNLPYEEFVDILNKELG